MTTYTLAELRTRITRAQATDTLVGILTGLGFPTASWGPNSVPRALLEVASVCVEYGSNYAATLADFGFLATSWGAGLTELASSHYSLTRIAATRGEYSFTLATASGSGPYTIGAGALVVTDGRATARNDAAVTLTSADPVVVACTSDVIGTTGALTLGSVALGTPLAGVSITASSQTTAPQDEETDAALQQRCQTRWAGLSIETTDDGVISCVRNSGTGSIQRVKVDSLNPRGAGTVDVYCATSIGAPGSTELAAAISALDERAMGTVGDSSSFQWQVVAASALTITPTWTVYLTSGADAATVKAAVDAAFTAYVNSLDIGGKVLGGVRSVPRNDIIARILSVAGVSGLVLSAPAADVTITSSQVAVVGTLPASGSYVAT
jgi:phage-related baseplate assembly protein